MIYLLALLGGVALPLAFAPFDFWVLAFLSPVVLLYVLQKQSSLTQHLFCGWLYGLGAFGVGVSWVYVSIHVHGYAPMWLASILTAVFVAGIACLFLFIGVGHFYGKRYIKPLWGRLWLFALLWLLVEWLRTWFLSGFPWLLLGASQLESPFAGYLPIFGELGVGFLCVLVGCLCYLFYKNRAKWVFPVIFLLFIGGWGINQVKWTRPVGDPVSVALVQANIAQSTKWELSHLKSIVTVYEALTQPLLDQDLIVWPETAIPVIYEQHEDYFQQWHQTLTAKDTALVMGVATRSTLGYHNSVMGLGKAEGVYHKQVLVPFGEYVPFESWLRGLIQFFNLPMSRFVTSDSFNQPLHVSVADRKLAIAPLLCYEIAYGRLARPLAKKSDVILTVSNDSWFGHSIGPLQHFQIARVRAKEFGRMVLRGTNNGVTAVIDQNGDVVERLPQFEVGVLKSQFTAYQGQTPFMWWGDWWILLLFLPLLWGCNIKSDRRVK